MRSPIRSVTRETVTIVKMTVGDGTSSSPLREVTQVFTDNGECIAKCDVVDGEPDHFGFIGETKDIPS